MNLVQINERLKDLPMQVLQQYANGMNPEVPPYLALGELQRREISQKQAATAQGGQQGQPASVKEQVEQKAGLMAAQALRQQQAMQQMQQRPMPGPVPEGTPQPETQPQPEMMARGGLAGIPVRRDMFEYAGGGIIAFQAGGSVEEKYKREAIEMGEGKRVQFSPDVQTYVKQLRASEGAEQEGFAERERQQMLERSREIAPEREAPMAGPNVTEQTMRRVGPMTAPKFADERMPQAQPSAGLPAALPAAAPVARPKPQMAAPSALPVPSAPRPAAPAQAAPAGLPAALSGAPQFSPTPVSPDRAELEAMMKEQRQQAPTAEGIKADVSALMPAGMQEEAMQKRFAEQRARAEAGKEAYEKSQPTGLDNLIRVLGQAGQYKGFSGIGPAYTAMQQQRRAEDLAFQKQQDELMTAIEGREYGANKDVFAARSGAMDRAKQLFGESEKSILNAAAKKYEVEQGRLSEENKAKMALDLRKFELAQQEKLKGMDITSQEKMKGMDVAERRYATDSGNIAAKQGVEYVNLMAQSRALAERGDKEGAARLAARAQDILTVRGGTGTAGVGAGRNAIMERRQTMQELQQIIKDEGMVYTDAQKADAARQYQRLAMQNVNEGEGGAPKVMTQADVLATARSSGKTPQQVIEAAKARGYTIQ